MAKRSIEECIETATNMAQDLEYKLNRAKDPKNKRTYQHSLDFWKSIKEHLETAKTKQS